jgi:mRNA-degrading endonuclease RelE of RelBE toxin-antitoxin system
MTRVGAGGVIITSYEFSPRFKRDLKKLPSEYADRLEGKLKDLTKANRPPGLSFEKLNGHRKPDIYTVHIDGNYKMSMEIAGSKATLRRISDHNEIDRCP